MTTTSPTLRTSSLNPAFASWRSQWGAGRFGPALLPALKGGDFEFVDLVMPTRITSNGRLIRRENPHFAKYILEYQEVGDL